MITLLPEKNKDIIKKTFDENNLEYNENCGVLFAKSGEEILGFSLYSLSKEQMTIFKITAENDILLADGIIRSTLHIATEKFVLDARYSDSADKTVFEKLGFIKDENEKTLDTDKLFRGCNCQN